MAPTGRARTATDETTQRVRFMVDSPPSWAFAEFSLVNWTALRVGLVVQVAACSLSRGQVDHALRADGLLQGPQVSPASCGDAPGRDDPDRQRQDRYGGDDPQGSLHSGITSSPIFVDMTFSGSLLGPGAGAPGASSCLTQPGQSLRARSGWGICFSKSTQMRPSRRQSKARQGTGRLSQIEQVIGPCSTWVQ